MQFERTAASIVFGTFFIRTFKVFFEGLVGTSESQAVRFESKFLGREFFELLFEQVCAEANVF